MRRQMKMTTFLIAVFLMTGCGITKNSNEMIDEEFKLVANVSKCASDSDQKCVISMSSPEIIYFGFGSSKLNGNDRRLLDKVVERMGTSKRIVLTGHTCKTGSDEVNQKLSEQRVLAVKSYLLQKGVEERQISAWGKGSRYHIASNEQEATRKHNRRVEMRIFR